jgi:hypothetical protein
VEFIRTVRRTLISFRKTGLLRMKNDRIPFVARMLDYLPINHRHPHRHNSPDRLRPVTGLDQNERLARDAWSVRDLPFGLLAFNNDEWLR